MAHPPHTHCGPTPADMRLCPPGTTPHASRRCNGARCTRRMLAEAVMACVKERIGSEAWEALSDEERDR
eukprot:4074061-Prymnesium_polylepis.1